MYDINTMIGWMMGILVLSCNTRIVLYPLNGCMRLTVIDPLLLLFTSYFASVCDMSRIDVKVGWTDQQKKQLLLSSRTA